MMGNKLTDYFFFLFSPIVVIDTLYNDEEDIK